MNSSLKKYIAGIFMMASAMCYANVPVGAEFRAVAYDTHSNQFIAVGNSPVADILAVSKDGRVWSYHNIIAPGDSRANGKHMNDISIDDNGTIYLLGPAGDMFIAKETTPSPETTASNYWSFTRVPGNIKEDHILGSYFFEYPIAADVRSGPLPVVASNFVLSKIENSSLKQITRYDLVVTSGVYAYRPHIMKTGADIESMIIEVGPRNMSPFTYVVMYEDTNGHLFKSENGSTNFVQIPWGSSRKVTFPLTTQNQAILTTELDSVNKRLDVCNIDPFASATQVKCTEVVTPASLQGVSTSQVDIASTFSISDTGSPVSSNPSMLGVIVMSDSSDGKGIAVIPGEIKNNAFVYRSSSPKFEVASRTCATATGDGSKMVILGKDNKALLSTNGGTQWQIVNM